MKPTVMIGPAQLKEMEQVYAPVLAAAGYDYKFPERNVQMVEAEVLAQMPGCVASLAGSEPYNRRVIEALAAAGLKVIARAGVGYDGVDVAAATDHGIPVTIAPGTNQDAVAEHTFLLMLALAKNLISQNAGIKAGTWPRKVTRPLRGRTLGVVGLGRIGKAVAVRGRAWGMTVVGHDPFADADFAHANGIALMPFDDVLREADFLTLHMPLVAESKQIINARAIGLMKPTAFLINTSRGGVIHEADLADALTNGRLAGAGLDVLDEEPPPAGHPLVGLDNVILTAHTAGIDTQSRDDMGRVAAEAIVKLLAGEWPADWIVNPEVKPAWDQRRAEERA